MSRRRSSGSRSGDLTHRNLTGRASLVSPRYGRRLSFDLDASALRADGADLAVFVEVLARKLEGALPAETDVRRRSKGLLSREKVVEAIEVSLGDHRYALQREAAA